MQGRPKNLTNSQTGWTFQISKHGSCTISSNLRFLIIKEFSDFEVLVSVELLRQQPSKYNKCYGN